MRHGGAWLLLAMSFAGCEDAAKRPVAGARPGAGTSTNTTGTRGTGWRKHQPMQTRVLQAGPSTVGNLPLRNLKTQPLISADARGCRADSLPD